MKYFFILLTALIITGNVNGQTAEDSVKTVINTMFAGNEKCRRHFIQK